MALVLFGVAAAAADPDPGYKVVVGRDATVAAVSRTELADLFLKRKEAWPDGQKVAPIDQLDTTWVRERFSRDVHGRHAGAIKRYWLQVVFSGRGVPPLEKASDREVIDYVKSHPGAVGYVSPDTSTKEVKVLRVGS